MIFFRFASKALKVSKRLFWSFLIGPIAIISLAIFLSALPTFVWAQDADSSNSDESGEVDIYFLINNMKEKNAKNKTEVLSFKEFSSAGLQQGQIKKKKPDKMLVVYFRRGNPKIEMYVNSSMINIHLLDYKIVYQQDVSARKDAFSSFDGEYLFSLYNFSFFNNKETAGNLFSEEERRRFNILDEKLPKVYHLKLEPKDKTFGLDDIQLWINKDGTIRRTRSVDIEGRVVEFYFYDIVENEFISDNEFDFVIPADVRVVKNLVEPVQRDFLKE